MKPEFSKPFNLEHARAGAPIANRYGSEAFFVAHVPEAVPQSRVIIRFKSGEIGNRRENGKHYEGGEQVPGDLVMLPLGLIDGKPVFVGDEFLWPVSGDLRKASPDMAGGDWARCSWPAPAKVYPTSVMHESLLRQAFDTPPTLGSEMLLSALQRVADAAIRFSIDAGQVAPVSEAKPGLRPHNPYTGALRDPRDIETDPMGVLVRHPDEPLRGIEGRAARDMAIAEAVRNAAYVGAMNCQSGHEGTVIRQLDLDIIVATIK